MDTDNGQTRLLADSTMVVIGSALNLCYEFSVMLNVEGLDAFGAAMMLLLFIGGYALCGLMRNIVPKRQHGLRGASRAICILAAFALSGAYVYLILAYGTPPSTILALFSIVGLLLGICSGYVAGIWLEDESVLPHGHRRGSMEKAFALAALITAILSMVPAPPRLMVMMAFLPVSTTLALLYHPAKAVPTTDEETPTPRGFEISRRALLCAAFISAGCAFCIAQGLGAVDQLSIGLSAGVLAVVSFGILVFILRVRPIPFSHSLGIAMVAVVLMLLTACAIFPLPATVASAGAFVTYEFICCLSLIGLQHIAEHLGLDYNSYAIGRRKYYLYGFLLGLCIGFIALFSPSVTQPLAGLMILAIVISCAALIAPMGTPTESGRLKETVDDVELVENAATRSDFLANCATAAKRFGLTPRESEVFTLLAQGLSVPVIADTLVISQSTVKVHSANIYRKMDVHSKQDIIALVNDSETR